MLPTGFLADSFRSWIPLVLGTALFFSGLAYFLAGLSATYIWVLLSLALLGVGLWDVWAREWFGLGVHLSHPIPGKLEVCLM